MGEIADALRRARGGARSGEAPASGDTPPGPRVTTYTLPSDPRPVTPHGPRVDLSLDDSLGQETIIPRTRQNGAWIAREVLLHRGGSGAESYRQFALQVQRGLAPRDARSLLVVGPLRQEGKTTTACNLAFALASLSEERSIALVDCDLRRPAVARSLGITPSVGMETVFAGQAPLGAARIRTDLSGLDLYLVREAQRSPETFFGGPAFAAVLQVLEKRYDVVLMDTPPVLLVPDTPLMARHADAILVVARSGQTRVQSVKAMLDALPREKLIGTLLNQGQSPQHARQYGYYLDEEHA